LCNSIHYIIFIIKYYNKILYNIYKEGMGNMRGLFKKVNIVINYYHKQ